MTMQNHRMLAPDDPEVTSIELASGGEPFNVVLFTDFGGYYGNTMEEAYEEIADATVDVMIEFVYYRIGSAFLKISCYDRV